MLRGKMRAAMVAVFVLAWSTSLAGTSSWEAAGSGVPQGLATTGSRPVVVNEIAAGLYVELRNRSESTVDIGGLEMLLCGTSEVTGQVRVPFGQELASGDFYLIVSASFTGADADQVYAGVLPGGGAALLDPEHRLADGVAVIADSPCGEGDPAPVCPRASTARDVVSTDTGCNVDDFSCRGMSPGRPN